MEDMRLRFGDLAIDPLEALDATHDVLRHVVEGTDLRIAYNALTARLQDPEIHKNRPRSAWESLRQSFSRADSYKEWENRFFWRAALPIVSRPLTEEEIAGPEPHES
jgi:hypothetical protein